ncbi:TBC1 domain family member 22A-like isoform X1 [Mirounga angustirostris]|uniref:TBC1 domain family member 22A-like isoform X1 n=1 Tax=Mirounga angustirostris TaxID=9716 RepID=UPI00313B653B
METAHRVLRNHSQRQERRKPQEAPGPEQEPQPSAEPPSVPSGDLRLVKSVSESHTSCPADSAGDTAPLQRSQSLPHSVAAAVGGTSDPSALSSSALSEREASRLDKFKQLLAGPNTDLGAGSVDSRGDVRNLRSLPCPCFPLLSRCSVPS